MPFFKNRPLRGILNSLIDKLLKSPDSTHTAWVVLIGVVLEAIGEGLVPRVVTTGLSRTPIEVNSKTANHGFLQVQ